MVAHRRFTLEPAAMTVGEMRRSADWQDAAALFDAVIDKNITALRGYFPTLVKFDRSVIETLFKDGLIKLATKRNMVGVAVWGGDFVGYVKVGEPVHIPGGKV